MQRATVSAAGLASPGGGAAGQRSDRPAAVEDCRDYLRTGRCKYGASCKYNHPPNVQSGGGMKTPIDPTEPLFPIRPNEPLCQYYMKHGTCKFGQACKFHHPPQTATPGGAPAMMNRRIDAPRMILNPVGTDGSSMMLQFLPQRPDEPDCIYFLKNGRCKYGTTCRYHHPINGSFQHRRQEEVRRGVRQTTDQFGNKIQFVSQGQISQGIVSDGPVAIVSVDGAQTLAPVTFIQSGDWCAPVAANTTVATEQASSVSSIGSSHDTSGSTLEYIAVPGDGTNTLWQRVRKTGSGGSLNAYAVEPSTRLTRAPRFPTSSSDGNIARRDRSASHGSASDQGSVYFEPNASPETAWRQNRSASFDQTRRSHEHGSRSPSMRGRPPPSRQGGPRMVQHRSRQGQGDEGFTMMTSALLNMLDTPEETSAEVYSEDGTYHYAVDDDDATMLMGGLSLEPHITGPPVVNAAPDFDDSRWSPSWQRPESHPPQGQDMIHPYMRSQPPASPTTHMQFHHHTPPSSEHHSDFGQYLP